MAINLRQWLDFQETGNYLLIFYLFYQATRFLQHGNKHKTMTYELPERLVGWKNILPQATVYQQFKDNS